MSQVSTASKEKFFTPATMAMIAIMAAVTCILGPLSIAIPISPVPISLTNFAIYLSLYVLGQKKGTVSFLVYLLLGFIGLPVFSKGQGGAGILLGPTGGYLFGFIFMALIGGWFIEHFPKNYVLQFVGLVLGTMVCYVFGTVWLAYVGELTLAKATAAGVIPFIPGDLVKIVLSILIGTQVRGAMRKQL